MGRKGRYFELLIKQLEEVILPIGAKITSPGFLKDKITNHPREVDILIEHNIGTSNIIIAIECRDRSSKQDTTWIEQIKTKIENLDVHKVIAVSSRDFSENAKKKANFFGIETRTFSEIDKESISDWCALEYITSQFCDPKLMKCEIGLDTGSTEIDQFENVIKDSLYDKKIFYKTIDNTVYSILEIIPINELDKYWKGIEKDSSINIPLRVNYCNPNDRFYVKNNDNICHVLFIIFHMELNVTIEKTPISRIVKYSSEENTISQIIEFKSNNEIIPSLQFIRNEGGTFNLSLIEK